MSENKDEIIGYIKIRELRREFETNYIIYVITDKTIPHLGVFDIDYWNYAYAHELESDTLEVRRIDTPIKLPKEVNVWFKAMKKVSPEENLYVYRITLWSNLPKSSVENRIADWLKNELQTYKIITFVYKLPRAKKVTKIPITKEMFEKMLEKMKQKGT